MAISGKSQWDDASASAADGRPTAFDKEAVSQSEVQYLWQQGRIKRRFSLFLARIRKAANLTQREVADRSGWDKSFVSRMEGSQGQVPDVQTIVRFAAACNATIGLVAIGQDDKGESVVIDALVLPVKEGDTQDIPPILDFLQGEKIRHD
jgi:transcriptional regulator with XRE-family HTH domain